MAISAIMIFLTLVVQFKHAFKPFLVFAAIPYGMVGAIGALWVMGAPFGFMAFLGIASLVGVIALFPLAAHGGPLWEPLCYAQIGGLTVATVITLLLVPVLCAIFVRDLRLVSWER
jgi:multidrug efflux pump subunit AcrB